MRELPWNAFPPTSYEGLFFVVREMWLVHPSSMVDYDNSDELNVNNNGVFGGNKMISFIRNKQHMVSKHLRCLDFNIWKVFALRSESSTRLYVDAYVNVGELSRAINSGIRFNGREILFKQIHVYPQEIRFEDFVLEGYRNRRLDLTKYIDEAFENEFPYFRKTESVLGLKTPLFEFQKKSLSRMIELEDEGVMFEEISKKYTCILSNDRRVWFSTNDVFYNTEDCETSIVHFKGGFLTDKMGMGKTLTAIALCLSRPIQSCENMMRPKSTLVICPSHIVSHWSKEIDKHTNSTHVAITVKDQIEKNTVRHIMSGIYEFVIVSFNVFCNPSFRHQMEYYSCPVVQKSEAFAVDFVRQSREEKQKQKFMPHIYNWGRIIIDEFHELGNSCYPNVSSYVASLKSEKTWFISGTPSINSSLYRQLIPYKMFGEAMCTNIPVLDVTIKAILASNVNTRNYDEVNIPPVRERVIRIELNRSERLIYDGIRSEGRDQQLKVCSYARLAKCLTCETEVQNIDEMKETLKKFLDSKVETLEKNLVYLNEKVDGWKALVPDVEARTREAFALKNYVASKEKCERDLQDTKKTIEYVKKSEQTECVICLEEMDAPCVIKSCGHKICSTCLPLALRSNSKCPVCRTEYVISDVIKVNKDGDNEMLRKYGSKLFNLLQLLENTSEVKTLIFSQWDELLKDVGKCITSYDESKRVLFCRGNIMQKKVTTDKFSNDDKYNLLLLSTVNAGSGCDLSMARRVILLDTIDGSGEFITGIERQAIARCHRIGQNSTVEVVRYVAKDTIEEEIYDRIRERS